MSIDTQNKRRSVPCFPNLSIAAVPHGAVQGTDRYPIGWVYSGIASVPAETFPFPSVSHVSFRTKVEVIAY